MNANSKGLHPALDQGGKQKSAEPVCFMADLKDLRAPSTWDRSMWFIAGAAVIAILERWGS